MESRLYALARLLKENSDMRILKLPTCALTASIALTALAGCGGNSQMTPASLAKPGTASAFAQEQAFQNGRLDGFVAMQRDIVPGHGSARPSFMDPRAAEKPLVFASYGDGTIGIYLQGGKNKMVGQITGLSSLGSNLATDTARNLYSANYSNPSSVTVYAPPYTNGPKLTLSPRLPAEVAVSRQGTVAVAACTIPSGSCGPGVLFYAAGSATPCATVVLDPSVFPYGASASAFDRKGNLYVGTAGTGTEAPVTIGRIDGGCNAKKVKTFTTANSVVLTGDVRVDKAGRLAILTAVGTYPYTIAIDTYDPPKKGSLGNPVSSTSLPGSLANVSGTFAFQASGRRLWAGYYAVGPSYAAAVYEFAYPGGAQGKTITGPSASATHGVAVTPALVP
jgi:hypothetical protein